MVTTVREITQEEVKAAARVLHNWGGLRDWNADELSIVKTMLMAAARAAAWTDTKQS